MKQASNSFTKGMVLDTHPLTTQNTQITDALNATLVTFNGNEMMLQNDMGNTLIQDSATGNIMGLNPGFIPIGLKEHGGIMYIASVNKEGKGEIGTIPSPIIRDFYKEKNTYNVNKEIPLGETPIQISNKFYPADKFIVNLDMEIDEDGFKDTPMHLIKNEPTNPADWQIVRYVWKINNSLSGQGSTAGIETPIISYNSGNQTENLFSDKGIYKLNLYAKNNSLVKAGDNLTSALGDGENHWFYHNSNYTFPKDLMEASLSGIQKQFPSNSKPGYLAVSLELESVGSFSALPRTDEPLMVPYIYKKSSNTHYAYFPGFKYTTDNGLYINTLKNIKVIDEQTDTAIGIKAYTQSSSFTDSIDKLIIDGSFMPSKETDDSWALLSDFWCPVGFYRFESQKISQQYISNNEFYLSPIVWNTTNQSKLKSHSYTDTIQSYPRLGLFCADLGDKFNNWYRLELDYYDQFDGYQGHFEQRFNPYLNNVFGTNLSTNDIEIANSLKMGNDQSISVDLDFETETKDVTIKWATSSISLDNLWPTTEHKEDFTLAEIIPVKATQITYCGYDEQMKYLYAPLNIQLSEIDQTQIDWNEAQFRVENLQLYPQWYGNLNGVTRWHNVGEPGGSQPSAFYLCNENGDINSGWENQYEYSNNQGTIVFRKFTMFDNSTTVFGDATNEDLNSWILTSYNGQQEFTKNKSLSPSVNITLAPTGQDFVAIRHSNVSGTFPTLYRRGTSTPVWLDGQLGGNQEHRSHWCWAGDRRFVIQGTVKDFEFNGSVSMNYPVIPIYSIVPYFLLKGKNNEGNSVYISRFGGSKNHTLTYECNFELDSDGIPYNYLDLDSSSMPGKKTYTSDYNSYIKDLPRYLYEVSDQASGTIQSLHTAQAVQPGIYVLNMTLCPGRSNWIKSGTNPIIDLNITMNGKTYSDITTNSYWRMTSDILKFEWDGAEMQFSPLPVNDIDAFTRPYNPLVLIVRQPSVIQLEFIKKLEGHNFEFQQIGLYRVDSDVPLPQLYEQLSRFNSDIYMYQNYMSLIAQYAAQEETPAKKYAYTQRFGAFFREGYVFTEGVYDIDSAECIMHSVKVGNKTYYSIPYIPAEPYILPVKLNIDDKNNVTYSWNTYFMTKIGSNPEFVITNEDGLPTSITNQSKLNALRTTN